MKRKVGPPRQGRKIVYKCSDSVLVARCVLLLEFAKLWTKVAKKVSKMMPKSEPELEKFGYLGLALSKATF